MTSLSRETEWLCESHTGQQEAECCGPGWGLTDIKGKTISWDAIVIFQLKNGKIVEEWINRDELGALLTAGILKPN